MPLQSLAAGEREARQSLELLQDPDSPQAAELWHQFALLHLLHFQLDYEAKDRELARDYWQRALTIQERTGRHALQARSINHLAELELAESRARDERLQREEADHSEAVLQYERADDETRQALIRP